MRRALLAAAVTIMGLSSVPALADNFYYGREVRHDRAELQRDRAELRRDQWAYQYGAHDRRVIRADRREIARDRMELRRDLAPRRFW